MAWEESGEVLTERGMAVQRLEVRKQGIWGSEAAQNGFKYSQGFSNT